MRYLRQFGRFLYDFLVGDSWELFVGPIVGLLAAWALLQIGLPPAVVGGLLVVAVLLVGAINVALALRASA
jgi:hypothetical protein